MGIEDVSGKSEKTESQAGDSQPEVSLFDRIMSDNKTSGSITDTPKTEDPPATDTTTTTGEKPAGTGDTAAGQPEKKTGDDVFVDPEAPPPAADTKTGDATVPPTDTKGAGDTAVPPADTKGAGDQAVPPAETKEPASTDQATPPADTGEGQPPAERKIDAVREKELLDIAFNNSVQREVEIVAHHMDNASVFLRQRRVNEALNAFDQAAKVVTPEEQKQHVELRKDVKELLRLEQEKPETEQDAEKLKSLKKLERNLYILERAPGFTRGNAALVLYQTGNVEDADMVMKAAVAHDPQLKDDPNFNNRRRQIEEKHGIKILPDVFAQATVPTERTVDPEAGRGPPKAEGDGNTEVAPPPRESVPPAEVKDGPPAGTDPVEVKPEVAASDFAPVANLDKIISMRSAVSPTDSQGRSPVEQVGLIIKEASEAGKLTPEMRQRMEKAIEDADKGRSPKNLGEMGEQIKTYSAQLEQALLKKVGDGADAKSVTDTVADIDNQAFEKIKGLPLPPGVDKSVTEEQYRKHVEGLYLNLDEAQSEEQYQELVKAIKDVVPGNKEFQDLIDKRSGVLTEARKALLPLNRVEKEFMLETNQSAVTRVKYAQLLQQANDPDAAKRYFTEAFAMNQVPNMTLDFMGYANSAGVDNKTLIDAAIEQNEKRDGYDNGKALNPEIIMQLMQREFEGTPQEGRAAKLKELAPSFEKLNRLTDRDYNQLDANLRELDKRYQDALPADPQARQKVLDAERVMQEKEANFSEGDVLNATILLDPKAGAQEKLTAQQALRTSQPEWTQALDDWQNGVGEKAGTLRELKLQSAELGVSANQVLNNKFFSRGLEARLMLTAGDKDGARGKITEAFQAVPSAVREAFLKQPGAASIVTESGADPEAIKKLPEMAVPGAPPAKVEAVDPGANPGTNPGANPGDGATTDKPAVPEIPAAVVDADGLNPKFKDVPTAELQQAADIIMRGDQPLATGVEILNEMIARGDKAVNDPKVAARVKVIEQALETGKDVTVAEDGTYSVSETALTEERKIELHTKVYQDLDQMAQSVAARRMLGEMLKVKGGEADIAKIPEIITKGNEMAAKIPADLMKKSSELLRKDADSITDAGIKGAFVSSADALDTSMGEIAYRPNPKFFSMSIEELERHARTKYDNLATMDEGKEAYAEAIKRYDHQFEGGVYEKTVQGIEVIQKALAEGKDIGTDDTGKIVVSDQPLTEERRFFLHAKVVQSFEEMTRRSAIRQEFAQVLRSRNQYESSEKYAIEAKDMADKLPIDLMKQQNKLIVDDIDKMVNPKRMQALQAFSKGLIGEDAESGAIKMPLNTRRFLTQLYLGTEVEMQTDGRGNPVGVKSIKFGQTSAFKPEKAYDTAMELRDKTKEILGFDPMDKENAGKNPGITTLFAGMSEVVGDPEKYNLYSLVEDHKLENMQKALKGKDGFDSLLLDVGVVAVSAGLLLASRNPKVISFAEKTLGYAKIGPEAAARMTRVAGLVAVPTVTLPMRHYGYELLTGQEESWASSSMHVAGSLLAAEGGSRVLGRGSLVLGTEGLGPRAFRNFDKAASADWMAKQGYETTGKLMDALKGAGFIDDAARFAGLPRGTAITSEEALKVIESAKLTHARMGGVAEALVKDADAAVVFQDKMANALAGLETNSIKTVDDLAKFVERDRLALQELAAQTSGSAPGTKIADALGAKAATAEGQALIETANSLGLKNVGQVSEALVHVERMSMSSMFPKIHQLRASGAIEGTTTLADVARMGTHVFQGRGLNRIANLVPREAIGEVLTPSALRSLEKPVSPLVGDKPSMLRSALDASTNFGRNLISGEGRAALWEGTKSRTMDAIGSVPTKLGGAKNFLVDRFVPRTLDPATATPRALARARWANGFRAAGTTALIYNSTAKTWDMTDQIDPSDGKNYTPWEALREANFPSVGEGQPLWVQIAGGALQGTPGQAFFGAGFLRQGTLSKSVLADESIGAIKKSVYSVSPLSTTAWGNWNARYLTGTGLGGVTAFGGTQSFPLLIDNLFTQKPEQLRMQNMLRRVYEPIKDEEIPKPEGANPIEKQELPETAPPPVPTVEEKKDAPPKKTGDTTQPQGDAQPNPGLFPDGK